MSKAAITAAAAAQREFEKRGLDDRRKAIACIRRICTEQAEQLGREELEETKIGRLVHKIEKLKVIADRIPGVEFLQDRRLQRRERRRAAGIRPVRPHRRHHAGDALAADAGLQRHQHARRRQRHRLQSAPRRREDRLQGRAAVQQGDPRRHRHRQPHHDHRDADARIGPGDFRPPRRAHVVRHWRPRRRPGGAASPKRAVVAGPGNPPVVVDETADLDNAARSIIAGAAYDNNLLCIGEKEVFAVAAIFDELMEAMTRYKAVRLDAKQIDALTKAAFVPVPTRSTSWLSIKTSSARTPPCWRARGHQSAGRHGTALRRNGRVASVRRSRADDAVRAVRARAGRG